MSERNEQNYIEKVITGIPGFDLLSEGGLPKGRTTLVAGTAGSGKTIFACQFLAEGITEGQHGVFVTFEESPKAIRKNMWGFGWDIQQWEEEGKWVFVDASPKQGEKPLVSGEYDLGPLLARIEYATKRINAQRVSMDSLGAVFSAVPDSTQIRGDLFNIAVALREREITAILTSERTQDYGDISRYSVEEFVADNVIILRNVLAAEKRHRTIEILKYRGTSHQHGEFPFTIIPEQGFVVIPFSTILLEQRSSNVRITSGNAELDAMCGGGFFRDSIVLVSGATGTGKTLRATEFIAGGVKNGERCLLFAFEESREQLFRNAVGWNIDFAQMEQGGMLKVVCRYPETTGLENHLVRMQQLIEEFQPQRVAVDSISALERSSSFKKFREFILSLNALIKQGQIAALFTSNTNSLIGGRSITEAHISTNTDSIILLRYVEVYGEIRRGLTVLKMRGSMHDKEIREFCIDSQGMHIGRPFRNVTGILAGNPSYVDESEIERLSGLFDE
ncbi:MULTISPECIES: circadian clock protein KaiC [unclassified Coleofasciculus]|uniref:circadian clock protein KaiC n=1 Tax=unclassified Coleofasciculus TaxID=2692782 RepID=UPI00187F5195|nr:MULTISPECIES: circadian clock protein KaiC [unclassified Coleofasciculus]MBE9130093.1 circadian clock protein KaiC [Coleofasciculus sp. LEGE 07081]MBE9152444.1 circadian clock protein KaiC [Coleofasciculus sp. LEGE 07092]